MLNWLEEGPPTIQYMVTAGQLLKDISSATLSTTARDTSGVTAAGSRQSHLRLYTPRTHL
jgi:hypothetical protein